MNGLFALTAPLALVLPVMTPSGQADAPAPTYAAPTANQTSLVANPLTAFRPSATAQQVRIDRRVMIRIAPQVPGGRQNLLAQLPQREIAARFEERSKEKCVPLDGIAGVQTGSGNRLVLYLRDQRMISVNLEKSCHARDFYSGFYVERSKDGRLCADRDKLQSRTGARCDVDAMHRLVAVGG